MISFQFIAGNRLFIYGDDITEVGTIVNGKDKVTGLKVEGIKIYIGDMLNLDMITAILEPLRVIEISKVSGGYVIQLKKESNKLFWRVNNQTIIMN